jgi:hypothetical protein
MAGMTNQLALPARAVAVVPLPGLGAAGGRFRIAGPFLHVTPH